MFFHSWSDIGRVVVVSGTVFLLIVAILRIVGQQALAKMSGFDVVFTVTMGSVLATVAVTRDITVSEALAALVTMLALQEVIRRLQSRFLVAHHAVRQAPDVLVWNGDLLEDRLRAANISADEIRSAVRKAGLRSIGEARIVVLENDGEWSVIRRTEQPSDDSALLGLPIPDRVGNTRTKDGHIAERAPSNRLP
jgi:uncharacterized membrane protein YcaP (DUF421 family)